MATLPRCPPAPRATAAAPGETGLSVPRQMATGNSRARWRAGRTAPWAPRGAAAAGQTPAANMGRSPLCGVGSRGSGATGKPAPLANGQSACLLPRGAATRPVLPAAPDGQPVGREKRPGGQGGKAPSLQARPAQAVPHRPLRTCRCPATHRTWLRCLPDGGVGPGREGPPRRSARGRPTPRFRHGKATARAAAAAGPYGGAAKLPAAAPAANRIPRADAGAEALRVEPAQVADGSAGPAGLAEAGVRAVSEREGAARAEAPPRAPAAQLASALAVAPAGRAEILLDPEELGRVRLTLVTSPEGVSVAVLAERPETLDLLRRGADGLADEFRALGFREIGFSFGHAGAGHREPGGGEAAPLPGPPAPPPGEGVAVSAEVPPAASPAGGGGLDLRW